MSRRTINQAVETEAPSVTPKNRRLPKATAPQPTSDTDSPIASLAAGDAVVIAVAPPFMVAKSQRLHLSKAPPSNDVIAAACHALLLDYLVGTAGLPMTDAEAAADRAACVLFPPPLPVQPASDTKLARLIALLRRPQGASLADMVAATGWQAHSVRGALSGALKKKMGLVVASEVAGDVRVYRLPPEG
jgi:hypothetical protein